MRNLLFVVCLFTIQYVSSQTTKYVGINIVPTIARTLELTSELRPKPAYGITFNTGYTFNTGHNGFTDLDVLELIDNRKTKGLFFKLGGRVYLTSLKGQERTTNFFLGAGIIGSQYNQKALKTPPTDTYWMYIPTKFHSKGFIVSPAVNAGFSFRISKKLLLETGLQHTLLVKRDDFIGRHHRNYQPGMGSGQAQPIKYIQGIINVKHQL